MADMDNQINQVVERIGQLPKMSEQEINECLQEIFKRERLDELRGRPLMCLTIVQSMADTRKDKHPTVAAAMDGLCAAYTKAVAENEKLRACAEHYARKSTFGRHLEFSKDDVLTGSPFEDLYLDGGHVMADPYDDDDDFYEDEHGAYCDCSECEFEEALMECGQMRDGGCLKAGSEHCDFECPFSD